VAIETKPARSALFQAGYVSLEMPARLSDDPGGNNDMRGIFAGLHCMLASISIAKSSARIRMQQRQPYRRNVGFRISLWQPIKKVPLSADSWQPA
jgi:hypothetical protein